MTRLLVWGLGYSGAAIARAAVSVGAKVRGTSRTATLAGVDRIDFDAADEAVLDATHVVSTIPPDASGDPVLARYREIIVAAPHLRWIGYLSTTGVYGDWGGAWVDEETRPAPTLDRARRRLGVEEAWAAVAGRRVLTIFRLAGIYGPGRSVFDAIRAGTARRILKPGHAFGRIHRDDVARAVVAAMYRDRAAAACVLNLADDEPAESAVVVTEAARLLGVTPPPEVPFEQAWGGMGPMARSFWAESRKVSSAKTQQRLGLRWLYPSYREGLRAILAEERDQRPA